MARSLVTPAFITALVLSVVAPAAAQSVSSNIHAGTISSSKFRRLSVRGPNLKEIPKVFGSQKIKGVQLDPVSARKTRLLQKSAFASMQRTSDVRALAAGTERLLIVYDGWSEDKYQSEMYAEQMMDLLSHFGYAIDVIPADQYTSGMIGSHKATFYMGVLYDTQFNTAFKNDVMNATKPVCWMGYNLWSLAWTPAGAYNKTFETKFGIRFQYLDDGYTSVTYKSTLLSKMDTVAAKMSVTNAAKATVVCRTKNDAGATVPYVIKSGNFWVVADNPLSYVEYADISGHDRTLVFCDIVHDILNTGAVEDHPAIVRIEDVSASADPAALRKIADILKAENVPFVISTIPIYRDPLGYWTNGVYTEIPLNQATDVVNAIKYMVTKGGQVIQHGTTHQYGDAPNPNFGISGDDWEFFRMGLDENNQPISLAPIAEESVQWYDNRLMTGKNLLAGLGFNVTGWLTPHYLASPMGYIEFAKLYEYMIDPIINFRVDPYGYLYYQMLFSPYPYKDHNGMVHIPETVNYITDSAPFSTPQDLITRSKKIKVVRDGWAGMYFHPFLDPALLRTAVRGIKNQGYRFVMPAKALGPVAK